MVRLSIIIPTLNEEKYLERLLKSIEKQDFEDYEIIVSDSDSKDDTIKIAKRYRTKIVNGERKGPGHARNLGAKKAKGEYLLFIDADVILTDKKILSDVYISLRENDIVVGTIKLNSIDGDKLNNILNTLGARFFEYLTEIGFSFAPGFFIFTKKELFEKVGGFDEELPYCEDHKLVKQLKKFGKLKVLDSKVLVSSRRLKEKGFFKTLNNYFFPTMAYFLNENYMKKNYKFEPATEIENKEIKNSL